MAIQQQTVTNRYHGLDFCRAVFMCLGLFFHCGLIYGTGQDWRVVSDETLPIIKYLANFIHHFRMEAFYLVSGFFYTLIFVKGRENFLQDRVCRALIPMLVIGFSLNFAMNHLSYNREYVSGLDYFLSGQWLGHLWFLGNLILYFLVSRKCCGYFLREHKTASQKQFVGLFLLFWGLALLGHWIAKTMSFSTVLFINFGYLFYYYPYFLLGMLSFVAKEQFYQLIRLHNAPAYLALYVFAQAVGKLNMGLSETAIEMLKMASHLPLMLVAFSILNFIGGRESSLVRGFSEASYTIYLLHQPLIIVLYVYLFDTWHIGALLEYCLLILSVLAISYGFHHQVVKRYWLARLAFNGDVNMRA